MHSDGKEICVYSSSTFLCHNTLLTRGVGLIDLDRTEHSLDRKEVECEALLKERHRLCLLLNTRSAWINGFQVHTFLGTSGNSGLGIQRSVATVSDVGKESRTGQEGNRQDESFHSR